MIVNGIEGNPITPVQTNLMAVRRVNFLTGELLSKGWRPLTPFRYGSREAAPASGVFSGIAGASDFFSATDEEPNSASTSQ